LDKRETEGREGREARERKFDYRVFKKSCSAGWGWGWWNGELDRKIEDVWRENCRQMRRYCAVSDRLGVVQLC